MTLLTSISLVLAGCLLVHWGDKTVYLGTPEVGAFTFTVVGVIATIVGLVGLVGAIWP